MMEPIVSVPTLEQCLSHLHEAIGKWRVSPSYAAGESICRWARQAWAAYYDLWLSESARTSEHREGLEEALAAAAELLRSRELDPERHSPDEQELLAKFATNVEFRSTLLKKLHTEGVEAVDRAIAERERPATR